MSITLLVQSGSLAGQSFTFSDASIPIGRDKSNVLKLTPGIDERASAHHCEIYHEPKEGRYYVRDLDSTNGTFVNNQRITGPVALSDGSLLKLGGTQGIEIVVKLPKPAPKTYQPTLNAIPTSSAFSATDSPAPNTNAAARLGESPIAKQGIGLITLEARLQEAKNEVRREYSRRNWIFVVAMSAMIVMGSAVVIVFVKKSFDTDNVIRVIKTDVDSVKDDIAVTKTHLSKHDDGISGVLNSVTSIKDSVASNIKEYRETVASMAQAMSEKERKIAALQVSLEQAGGESGSAEARKAQEAFTLEVAALKKMYEDVKAYQEKNKQVQSGGANSFTEAVAHNRQAIYAILFKATNATEQTLIGTAFAIDAAQGLLATSGNISQSIKDLLPLGQIMVACGDKSPRTYQVKKAIVHGGFTLAKGSRRSPDVGVLEVDLNANGKRLDGFPATLSLYSDSELDSVQTAQAVAMLGFPEEYKSFAASAQNTSLSAKLSMGVVSSTVSFDNSAAKDHAFDILEHTTAVGAHDEGSPVFDAKGRVIAIQNDSETELLSVVDKKDASKKTVKRFTVGNVKYAVNIRFLRDLLKERESGGSVPLPKNVEAK